MGIPMMYIVTPIMGWSWPALTPIVVATAGAMGYGLLTKNVASRRVRSKLEQKLLNRRTVEIPLESHLKDVVAEQLGHEEELLFEREDLVLSFGHDIRGKFRIRVMGPKERASADLQVVGDQFARELIQQFAYHRIAQELDRRGVQVVEETVDEEGNMVLQARRW